MTDTTTGAAEPRARETLAQHIDGDQLFNENGLHIRAKQCVSAMIAFATAEAASGAGEREANLQAQRQTIEACARIADRRAEMAREMLPGDLQQANMASQIASAIRKLAPNEALASLPPATDPAMVMGETVIGWLQAEQDRLDAEGGDYLMDTTDCINVVRERSAALAATTPATGHAATEGEGA